MELPIDYAGWLAALAALSGHAFNFVRGHRKSVAEVDNLDAQTIESLMRAVQAANDRSVAAWNRVDEYIERLQHTEDALRESQLYSRLCDDKYAKLEADFQRFKSRMVEAAN